MGAFASCVGKNKPAAAREKQYQYDASRQKYQQPARAAAESRRGESARRRQNQSGRMHVIPEDDDARSMRSHNKSSSDGHRRRGSLSSPRRRDSGLSRSTNGSSSVVQSRGNRHSTINGQSRQFSSGPSPARPPRKIVDRTEFSNAAAGRGHNGKRSIRRDDTSTISASLAETYEGYITNNDKDEDYLDEQSAIRRSLKEMKQPSGHGNRHQQQQQSSRQPRSLDQHVVPNKTNSRGENATQASELENWIEGGKGRGKKKEDANEPFDNVTTISNASKNPYRVLGISQSASPREIYRGYKKKMKETERTGGGEKAFMDVGNAYRRVKADMQRQQERQQGQQQARNRGGERSGGRSRRRKNRRPKTAADEEESVATRREAIESRLKDHGELVKGLFAADSKERVGRRDKSSVSAGGQVTTLQQSVQCQAQALSEMNIVPVEGGATNINEKKKTITNSCFYLSLAASYLSGAGAFGDDPTAPYYYKTLDNASNMTTVEMEIAALPKREKQVTMKLALQLKRAIEAAVLLVHPEWAESGMVGEEVQAFSDFLVYALDSDSVLGHLAIAVFDEASGFVDIYRGRHYGKTYPPTKVKTRGKSGGRTSNSYRVKCRYVDCDDETRRANTLTLRYIPGHYQPLLPELTKILNERKRGEDIGFTKRPMLEGLISTLEKYHVLHVVTDGRA